MDSRGVLSSRHNTVSSPYLRQRPLRAWLLLFILTHLYSFRFFFQLCFCQKRHQHAHSLAVNPPSCILTYSSLWHYLELLLGGWPEKLQRKSGAWSLGLCTQPLWRMARDYLDFSARLKALAIKSASAQFYPPQVKSGCSLSSRPVLQPLTVAIHSQNAAAKVCACVFARVCLHVWSAVEEEGCSSLCNPPQSLITSRRESSSGGRRTALFISSASLLYIIKHPYFHISLSPPRLGKTRST